MSEEIDSSVELIVTKSYPREGVIIISIYFQETFLLTFTEGDNKDQALLDSTFPDLTGAMKGFELKAYHEGHHSFKYLSVWEINETDDNEYKVQDSRDQSDFKVSTLYNSRRSSASQNESSYTRRASNGRVHHLPPLQKISKLCTESSNEDHFIS